MSALVVLISASLIIASGFLFAFIRATKKGQFEDVYTPSMRMLFDDVPAKSDPAVHETDIEKQKTK